MRQNRRSIFRTALLLGIAALVAPAWAGFEDFKLMRAIPADVSVAVHARDHAGKKFVNERMAVLWAEVEALHLEKDVHKLLKSMMEAESGSQPAEGSSEFDAHWQKLSDLFGSLDCDALMGHETAFALTIEFPAAQLLVLTSPPEDKVESTFNHLSELAKHLVSLAPPDKLAFATEGEGASVVHRIGSTEVPGLGIMLAREKGVILIGFGGTLPEQSIALLRGDKGKVLAETERYRAAFKGLPEPKDQASFVDVDKLFKQITGLVNQAIGMAEAGGNTVPEEQKALPGKILRELDIFDYVAEVTATDSMKSTTEARTLLKDGVTDRLLYKGLFTGSSIDNPLQYVPANAVNFKAFGGINIMALYNGVIEFVKKEIPGGEQMIQEYEASKAQVPFDFEKDLLALVGGRAISFSLAKKSAYSPGEWALLIGVNEEERAKAKLAELVQWGEEQLKGQQGSGTLSDATMTHATGFKTFASPMLMMMPGLASPTFGIKDGWMFLGSSPKVLDAALGASTAPEGTFAKNERFLKEGLSIEGAVKSASFEDMTNLGEDLASVLGMLPMIGMAAQDIYKNPVGRMVMTTLPKLSKVVRKLDFFQSSATRNTMEGNLIKTLAIVNYREPPPPPTGEQGAAEGSNK